MSDFPRRCCAYAGNANMNVCHQYTCPVARAPTRKLAWSAARWLSGVPREEREMGGRKTSKIMAYAFSLSKSRLKAARFSTCRREDPSDFALNKQDPRGGRGRFGIGL